jgi:hypothetical protein
VREFDERGRAAQDLKARQEIIRDELNKRWPNVMGLQRQIEERWGR